MKKLALFLALCLMVQCIGLSGLAEGEIPVELTEAVEEAAAQEPATEIVEQIKVEAAEEAAVEVAAAAEPATETVAEVAEAAVEVAAAAETETEAVTEAAEETIEKEAAKAEGETAEEVGEESAEAVVEAVFAELSESFATEVALDEAEEDSSDEMEEFAETVEVLEDEDLLGAGAPTNDQFTWRDCVVGGKNGVEITECKSDSTDIVIPEQVNENGIWKPVLLLSETTFARNANITSVMLDAAIQLEGIAEGCFENCTSLKSISFPTNTSFKQIPANAFRGCSSLNSISWPQGATIVSIGNGAFQGCTSLTTLTLPNGLQTLGDSAFAGCTALVGVTTPTSLKTIGMSAFSGCTSIINALMTGTNLTTIGDSAFYGCTSLRGIYIPDSVTRVGSSAFEGCSAATELSLSSAMTEINNFTFKGCTNLASNLDIPDSIHRIGREAFMGCSGIRIVYLRYVSNHKTIGSNAFDGIATNSVIFVEDDKAAIGEQAFNGDQTLFGWYGSTAHTYAINNPIEFVPYNVEWYINDLFVGFFGRTVDTESDIELSRALATGQMTAADIIVGLLDSAEFSSVNPTISQQEAALRRGLVTMQRYPNTNAYMTTPVTPVTPDVIDMLNDGVSCKYVAKLFLESYDYRTVVAYQHFGNQYPAMLGTITLTEARDMNRNTTAYVARCYRILLDRKDSSGYLQADAAGLNYWTAKLLQKSETGATIVANFLRSAEWADYISPTGPKKWAAADQVERLYLTMLNRSSSFDPGATSWVNALTGGDVNPYKAYASIEYVANAMAASAEFVWLCNGYGILPGTFTLREARDIDINVNRFVTRCYEMALGRAPDVGGLNDWCDKLLKHEITGAEMVRGFVFDAYEMRNSTNWASRANWLKILYYCYMGRSDGGASDVVGTNYWLAYSNPAYAIYVDPAVQEYLNRVDIMAGFAQSPEFKSICAMYGIL